MTDWLIYLPSTLKVWEDCRHFSASRCRGFSPNTTTCCEELLRHMPRLLWIRLVILCSQYTTTLTSSLPRNIFTALLFGLEEFLLRGERMTASCPVSASPGHLQLVCGRVICSWSHIVWCEDSISSVSGEEPLRRQACVNRVHGPLLLRCPVCGMCCPASTDIHLAPDMKSVRCIRHDYVTEVFYF